VNRNKKKTLTIFAQALLLNWIIIFFKSNSQTMALLLGVLRCQVFLKIKNSTHVHTLYSPIEPSGMAHPHRSRGLRSREAHHSSLTSCISQKCRPSFTRLHISTIRTWKTFHTNLVFKGRIDNQIDEYDFGTVYVTLRDISNLQIIFTRFIFTTDYIIFSRNNVFELLLMLYTTLMRILQNLQGSMFSQAFGIQRRH